MTPIMLFLDNALGKIMKNKLDIELSPELEKFRDKIESSIKHHIAIRAEKNEDLALWQSKFGGLPYLPKGCDYPKGTEGNPLFLLAQINFEEFSCLEGFPQSGILQFYIADDDFYGADWDAPTQQEGFRVVYFPTISQTENDLVTDFSFLPEPSGLPFFGCSSLQFEKKMAPVGITDYKFNELLGENFFEQFDNEEDETWDEYMDKFPSEGHKIGGYAYFTQDDPRSYGKSETTVDKEILLLQIDTDNVVDIMWGDSGVCNFFISRTDLENLDFSRVFYTWDCH
jgi:uncharacterized protein YwqG